MSKKAAILHKFVGYGGGARFSITIAKILEDIGFEVSIFSIHKIDPVKIYERFGKKLRRTRFISLNIPRKKPLLLIYNSLLLNMSTIFRKFDIIFNMSGDFIYNPLCRYKKYVIILYKPYHYLTHLAYSRSRIVKKIYYAPYLKLVLDSVDRLKKIKEENSDNILVFTDSEWCKLIMEKCLKVPVDGVIYPPVDLSTFLKISNNTERDGVISLANFNREKKQHIQVLIAKLAKEYYGIDQEFRICGIVTENNLWYFNYVKKLVDRFNLKNVKLYPNIPLRDLLKLLSRSKVFLHTMGFREPWYLQEPLSIACLEGIASGCLPLLYAGGGAFEIVNYKKEYLYTNIEEAVEKLSKLLEVSESQYISMRNSLISGLYKFSEDELYRRIIDIVSNLL